MAGPLAAPIIGAVGQLLGGLLGRNKQKPISAGDNAFSHVGGIMRASKQYGFNPLTLLGAVPAMGGTPGFTDNSSFGTAVANAAMIASDSIQANRSQAARLNEYQTQNQRLTEKLNAITLRPPVPGLYGRARMPSDPEVYGGTDGAGDAAGLSADRSAYSAGPAGGPPLRTVSPADPRREVDNRPQPTTSGVMVIDSPYVGEIYVPSLDGDEALDVLDLPSIAIAAPQVAYNRGNYLSYGGGSESRPSMTRAEALAAKDRRDLARKRPKAKPPFISLKGPTRYSGAWVQ